MKIDHLFYRHFSNKPVIVLIHGYSKRRNHVFDDLKNKLVSHGYHVICPYLYDQSNENDHVADHWLSKAESAMILAKSIKEDVVLLGFSMGGAIASYCASLYAVNHLILLAPAFEYITLKVVTKKVTKKVSSAFISQLPVASDYIELPSSFEDTFKEVISKTKESIKLVSAPLTIVHGDKDERIPLRSSEYAYQHAASINKRLIIFKDVTHNILDNALYADEIFHLIDRPIT